MSPFDQSSINDLPLRLVRQIDSIARQAEREWRAGALTKIEDYLEEISPEGRPGLFEELLSMETARLRQRGGQPSVDEFSKRFSNFQELVQRVIDDVDASEATSFDQADDSQPLFPRIPGYTIQRQLGRGAMGVVYLARQDRLQRLVALKVVVAGIDLRQAMSIIRAEAEIIARLRHPNIVQIYDVGEDHGEPFLTIEFVDGESLRERLLRDRFTPRQAAELVEQMARAMHHAHVHGVVHRDLKPANILLPRFVDGTSPVSIDEASGASKALVPKISDFGLAKVLDALHDQTQAGSLLGTPKYMSPEQAEGRSWEVGPATDVYALGAIFFEMLTGQAPFEGESSLKLLQRIKEQDVVFSDQAKRQLPADIQAICLKCLEKSPSSRYASAQELADDVRRFLDDFPVLARRPSRVDLFSKFVRRNRGLTISVGLILTTLIAGSIGTGFFAIREAKARRQAEVLAHNESDARLHVESLREKERHDVYWANLRMAQEAYKAGHVDDMRQLLQDVVPGSAIDQDLRGFEWNYLWRLSKPDARVLDASTYEGRSEFSPDGRWLAAPAAQGKIAIWETSSWKLAMKLSGHTDIARDVTFSPDGKKLASGARDGTVRLWDLESGRELCVRTDHGAVVRSVAFSPNGHLLVTADETEKVILWNVDDMKQVWGYSRPELFVMDVAWSPDNRQLALGCGRGAVIILGANDGQEVQQFHADHQLWLTGVAFSPNGERLATCGGDKTAKIWDLANITVPLELSGHSDWLTGVTFSSDESSIATSSRDGTVMIWNAKTGRSQVTLKGHSNWVISVAYSADNKQMASSSLDGTVRIWNPNVDWEFRKLTIEPVSVPCLAVADQGRKLIVGYADGRLSISDVKTGQVLNQIQAHSSYLSSVALSPDGQYFATASHDKTV